MMRNLLLKVVAPAALAVGALPGIASAHGHAYARFSPGCGYYPSFYYSNYCAPTYVAPAPAVVCPPAPLVVTPPAVYTAPPVVYTAPPVVYSPPVVVYSSGYYYSRPYFYGHVHYWRR